MRVHFSKKTDDMWEKIAPYTDKYAKLKKEVPPEIRKIYDEFITLRNKEYNDAAPW